jgi:hypothetical protein
MVASRIGADIAFRSGMARKVVSESESETAVRSGPSCTGIRSDHDLAILACESVPRLDRSAGRSESETFPHVFVASAPLREETLHCMYARSSTARPCVSAATSRPGDSRRHNKGVRGYRASARCRLLHQCRRRPNGAPSGVGAAPALGRAQRMPMMPSQTHGRCNQTRRRSCSGGARVQIEHAESMQ